MDFKQIDNELHKEFTGVDNYRILENAVEIAKIAKEMIARVPVIPTFNADDSSIARIMEFVASLKTERVAFGYHIIDLV